MQSPLREPLRGARLVTVGEDDDPSPARQEPAIAPRQFRDAHQPPVDHRHHRRVAPAGRDDADVVVVADDLPSRRQSVALPQQAPRDRVMELE